MSSIENFDIKSHIIESMVEVFDTMVSMEIEHTDSEPEGTSGVSRMVAGVNFAGNVAGILNIQVASDFARLMTANMLDMEPEELEGDGEIKDLLSEISNIVGGNLKSALNGCLAHTGAFVPLPGVHQQLPKRILSTSVARPISNSVIGRGHRPRLLPHLQPEQEGFSCR